MNGWIRLLAAGAAALCLALAAQAQVDKPVRILVGFAPGGSADIAARLLTERMAAELKQPVVVENKPGAGGRIAAEMLKNAAPDGATIMLAPIVVPVLAPLVFSKLPYNPATDFAPVGYIVIKAGSTANATTGWVFGTSNMSGVTGITYTFVDSSILPDRPQIS